MNILIDIHSFTRYHYTISNHKYKARIFVDCNLIYKNAKFINEIRGIIMPKKRDLRVQKTYNALFKAFQELLHEKDFDSITVTELCDRAMIRTATFYKHFEDKYAFFSFMVQEGFKNYRKVLTDTTLSCEDYYLNIVRISLQLLQHTPSLVHIIQSNSIMTAITRATGDGLIQLLVERLQRDQKNGCDLAAPPELTAEILIGAVHHLCVWKLEHQTELTDEEFINSLRPFVQRLLGYSQK